MIKHADDSDAENTKMPKKTYIEYYEDGLKYAKKAVEENTDVMNSDYSDD
jgi:hypothetical protein